MHLFWSCKIAKSIWGNAFPKLTKAFSSCRGIDCLMDLWEKAFKIQSKEELARVAQIFWTIWEARNQINHSTSKPDPTPCIRDIERRIESLSEEKKKLQTSRSSENHPSHISWKPSEIECWTMNSDAAWFGASKSGGIDWIIRDSDGSLIGAGCKKFFKHEPIKVLESKAIKLGLECLIGILNADESSRAKPIVVESNSTEVVNLINHKAQDLSEISCIIDEVEELALPAKVTSFSYCRRECNLLAHFLAHAMLLTGISYFL